MGAVVVRLLLFTHVFMITDPMTTLGFIGGRPVVLTPTCLR